VTPKVPCEASKTASSTLRLNSCLGTLRTSSVPCQTGTPPAPDETHNQEAAEGRKASTGVRGLRLDGKAACRNADPDALFV
jgi:hypothetical protein